MQQIAAALGLKNDNTAKTTKNRCMNKYADIARKLMGNDADAEEMIRELDIRAKYGVNIIAIRDGASINVTPDADQPLKAENVLVAVGKNEQLSGLQK